MRLLLLATIVLTLATASSNGHIFKKLKAHYKKPIVSLFGSIYNHIKHVFWKPPDFCHNLECPKYEVKKKADDYELRCYPSYKWAGTVTEGKTMSSREAFMRLFNYIQGENEQKTKIEMTVPVATKVELGKGKGKTNRYTMLFFVPFKYQNSPPEPTNPQVSIVTIPPVCAYVRSYGGFSTDAKVKENLAGLMSSLAKDKIVDYADPKELYFTGGYDAPWKLWGRHNEVWLIQKTKEVVNNI